MHPFLYFWKNLESALTKGSWHALAGKKKGGGSWIPLVWRAGHLKGVCSSKFLVPWPEPQGGRCSRSPGEWGAAGGLPYVHTLLSSHQNWILFRTAMCLISLLWLMRSEQSPGWHFWGSLLMERKEQAHTSFALYTSTPLAQAMGMGDGVLVTIMEPHL